MLNRIGKKLGHKEGGFTIIEVMIVLAVAGLIMAIVLVAIPQLQRNQRNSARTDIMGRIKTEIDSYAGNNNGRIPTDSTEISGFNSRYLNGVNTEDPQSGTNMQPAYFSGTVSNGIPTGAMLPGVGSVNYVDGKACDGESIIDGSNRTYALWTQLEGGAIFCLDNR